MAPRRAPSLLMARRAGTRSARRPAARAASLWYSAAISSAVELLRSTWQLRRTRSTTSACNALIGRFESRVRLGRPIPNQLRDPQITRLPDGTIDPVALEGS